MSFKNEKVLYNFCWQEELCGCYVCSIWWQRWFESCCWIFFFFVNFILSIIKCHFCSPLITVIFKHYLKFIYFFADYNYEKITNVHFLTWKLIFLKEQDIVFEKWGHLIILVLELAIIYTYTSGAHYFLITWQILFKQVRKFNQLKKVIVIGTF